MGFCSLFSAHFVYFAFNLISLLNCECTLNIFFFFKYTYGSHIKHTYGTFTCCHVCFKSKYDFYILELINFLLFRFYFLHSFRKWSIFFILQSFFFYLFVKGLSVLFALSLFRSRSILRNKRLITHTDSHTYTHSNHNNTYTIQRKFNCLKRNDLLI